MTVHAEILAIVPTANAKNVVQAKGYDIGGLMGQLHLQTVELQILLKQIIALHPSGGGDAANLTALNAILTELT